MRWISKERQREQLIVNICQIYIYIYYLYIYICVCVFVCVCVSSNTTTKLDELVCFGDFASGETSSNLATPGTYSCARCISLPDSQPNGLRKIHLLRLFLGDLCGLTGKSVVTVGAASNGVVSDQYTPNQYCWLHANFLGTCLGLLLPLIPFRSPLSHHHEKREKRHPD